MHRKNMRALSLIVCTFTYLLVGAAVFDALESETDMRRRALLQKLELKMKEKYKFSEEDYRVLETVVVKGIPHQAGLQWRFAGAFYFATLVITTVGYGHSTPATTHGKAFCILFALAGIPLGLVMFQSIGERLNALISFVLTTAKRELGIRREISPTHLIVVSGAIGSIVICLGTYVFHSWEGWSLWDSYYYCMMTLTTIGFGDFVPLQRAEKLNSDPGYVIFTLLFILFGLAVFSASVNLFVLRFMTTGMEVDTSEAEPRKTVFLENFSRESSLGGGSPTPTPKFSGLMSDPRRRQKTPALQPPSFPSLICGPHCDRLRMSPSARRVRLMSKSGHLGYTVRRAPTRIQHLLPPDPDAFLLTQLGGRRTSL